ncbi:MULTISPECIES: hypothetical protein [Salinibaculum]|uniref:hypothetical protein n=1 Tax=Salinibaculum TaxID=2732368 RepID=UPI0030D07C4C
MDDTNESRRRTDRLRGRRGEGRGGRGGGGNESRGTLVLSDREGYVGDTLVLKGRNFPPNERFEIQWESVQGRWGVLQAHEIVGPQFRPRTDTIATVEADAAGKFDEEWTIPEDYGGTHQLSVTDGDGQSIADAEFEIRPWFELEQTTAEMGESFTLRGYGLGPDVMKNNYQVSWDNGYVGFVTGVQNRGTATAEIRAVGPPGEHVVQVWRNYRGIPYLLNNTQSPFGEVAGERRNVWTVEVTEPEEPPRTAWMDPLLDEQALDTHLPEVADDTEATLDITPKSGQAGTDTVITGTGFPANETVDLTWYRHEGHEGRGTSSTPDPTITPRPKPDVLPRVTTDSDGRFEVEFEVPTDIGSTRPITAAVNGREVAATGFMMQPSIERFEPRSGPVGTEIEIELSGLGWTNYENAAMFVYDNDPLGYACGTGGDDETGTLNPVLYAAGEPGWHFIDVYPSLFEVEEDDPDFELRPHLSYLDNHPVRPLPAMHFAFEITE